VSAGGDVVAALTGSAATGSVGSVAPILSRGVTGNAATGGLGSVAGARTVPLTGLAATGAVGSVAFVGDVTVALSGVVAAGLPGSVRAPSAGDVPGVDLSYSETSTRTPKWWAKSGQDDEPEAVEAPKPKREPKKAAKAQEQAKSVIEAVARDQAARGDVPKSARFAEVRSQIKPLGSEATGFNWPALYERLYAQALTDAIRQEMAVADQVRQQQLMHEEETLLLLLAEA
jgi:hypothetical protein